MARIAPRRAHNRYVGIIERIFAEKFTPGAATVPFARHDLRRVAKALRVELPKNLGDLIYTFRYRTPLPPSIVSKQPAGREWVIRPAGRSQYCFALVSRARVVPSPSLVETKVPDATPGMISMYALSDEQALLAKLRYNRLVDIFTGVACYSLQSHLRTTVSGLGQLETDEVYVGLDKRGVHFVFPVQAKGGRDQISPIQIQQDLAMCREKFPALVCRPLGAQFISANGIALFEFEEQDDDIRVAGEKHYRLVAPDELTVEEIRSYRDRLPGPGGQ